MPVQFRDGTELTSSATLTVRENTGNLAKTETIWDISGVEVTGQDGRTWNLTLNPDNIQPNNFTFSENPEVIGQILNLP